MSNEINEITKQIHREQRALAQISLDFPRQRARQAKKIQALMKWQARLYRMARGK